MVIVMFLSLMKECDDNYFGLNCKEQCNVTCKSCNKSTGVCDNGCYAGWEGEFCEKGIYPWDSVSLSLTTICRNFS